VKGQLGKRRLCRSEKGTTSLYFLPLGSQQGRERKKDGGKKNCHESQHRGHDAETQREKETTGIGHWAGEKEKPVQYRQVP